MTATPAVRGEESPRSPTGRWQVRITDAGGRFCGAGVLVAHRYVVTCAHILNPGPERPAAAFSIDVPRAQRDQPMSARVAEGGWFPLVGDFLGDIAILELDHPLDTRVEVASLGSSERSRDQEVLVLGHPEGLPEGNWIKTKIIESIGTERVQLANTPSGIARGFSGGGVIDLTSNLVVGIVASTFSQGQRDAAFMIPMEVVAGYWPRLAGWLDGVQASEELVDTAVLARIADLLAGRRSMLHPSGLAWVIERLPDDVRDRLNDVSPSVAELVQACRAASELRVLVDLVYYRDGSSAGRGPIDDLLASYGEPPRPSDQPADLGPETSNELYDLLMRQQYFLDRQTRHVYLEAFAGRVNRRRGLTVEVPITDSAAADAATLVAECRRVPGAVRLLVDDFPYGDKDRSEFLDLLLFVEVLSPRRWLTDDERDALLGLLRGVPPTVLSDGHRRVAPVGELTTIGNAAALVRHIEKYNQQPDEAPRLFAFVEHIAMGAADLSASLRRWSDRVAARMRQPRHHMDDLRVTIAHLNAISAPAQPAQRAMPVLMVELAPDAQMPGERFLLTVALEGGSALDVRRFLAKSDGPAGLAAMLERLTRLGTVVADELGARLDDLTIEFVLPRALITEPADRWVIPTLAPEPIGVRFRVYLRSYERVHRKQYWANWNRKWDLVRKTNPEIGAVTHYVGPDDLPNADETHAALTDGKLLLVCGRPPAVQPRLRPADDFRAALEAGVPFVVWARDPAHAAELRAALEERLSAEPIVNLPDRVTEWRSDEWFDSEAAGLGSTVSLVVCDHDRDVPLTGRGLRAPGRMPS